MFYHFSCKKKQLSSTEYGDNLVSVGTKLFTDFSTFLQLRLWNTKSLIDKTKLRNPAESERIEQVYRICRLRIFPNLRCWLTKYVYLKSTTVYFPSSELGLSQVPTPLSPASVPLPPEPGGGTFACG